jgi:hypothetical protein
VATAIPEKIQPSLLTLLQDYFMIEVLKDLATQKLESAIKEFWDADEFMRTVQTIYNTTPPADRGLRDVVVRWSLINMDKIADNGNFEAMRAVEYGADLMKAIRPTYTWAKHECLGCHYILPEPLGRRDSEVPHECPNCGVNAWKGTLLGDQAKREERKNRSISRYSGRDETSWGY